MDKRKKKEKSLNHYRMEEYLNSLSGSEKEMLENFNEELKNHISISTAQNAMMLQDFHSAILYYAENGVSLKEALKRLDPEHLGGFYMHRATAWYRLDNAAIVYPLSMKYNQMPIFRLSVYLKEDVVKEILQIALTFTIKRFPSFATTVKQGFFWHYLDSTKRRFNVEEEHVIPCVPINVAFTNSQSFRVLTYKNRISVEFFHVLTDGSGGMVFLKTLTAEYLRLLGKEISFDEEIKDIDGIVDSAELENEFRNTELQEGSGGFLGSSAAQMSGKLSSIRPCQVIHLEMDARELKKAAGKYQATITAYLLAQMMIAGKYATEESNGEIHIQVPVNMRKFNHSKTVRNYSMYFSCNEPLKSIDNIDSIIEDIKQQLKNKSSYEEMRKMMSTTIKLISSLKYVPLVIKRPVLKIVYGFLGDQIFSNYLSNLGVIHLPEEMRPYVDKFDFVLGPTSVCRTSCSLITYEGKAVFSITKNTKDPSFEEKLVHVLESDGITVDISGSACYES